MDNEICHLKIEEIIPKKNIPHEKCNDYLHDSFVKSIEKHGVIQPIVVKKNNNKYEIIDGDRRYFAALMLGMNKIPALIRYDSENIIKLNLSDSVNESNLSPIEEAKKYRKMLDTLLITQEQLAKEIGKSQSALANKLRLLNLPIEIQDSLNNFEISERHARSLLTVKNSEVQLNLLKKIKEEKLTVRELDSEIKNMNNMFIPEEFRNNNNNNNDNNNNSDNHNNNDSSVFNSSNNGELNQSNNMFIPSNNNSLNYMDYSNNDKTTNVSNNVVGINTSSLNNDMNQYILPDNNGGINPFFTSNNYAAPSSNNIENNNNNSNNSNNNNISGLNPVNPFSSIRMNTNNINNNQNNNIFENSNDNSGNESNNFDINDYKLPEYENKVSESNNVNDFQSTTSFDPISIEPTNEYKYVEDNPNYTSVDSPKGVSSVDDVIEILRGSLDRIKNGKIKVDTEEIDYDDTYQITIRIDKKGDFL